MYTRKKKLPMYLKGDEVKTFLDSAAEKGGRHYTIARTFLATGIRVSELTGMNIEDINFDRDEIKIRGKGGFERIVDSVDPELFRTIKIHIGNRDKGPVFLNYRHTRLGRCQVYRDILYLGEKSIDRKVTPHMLRHTHAVHCLRGGVDLRTLQLQLGHSSINVTAIYLSVDRSDRKQVMEKNSQSIMNSMIGSVS